MITPLTPLDFKRRAVRLFGSKIGIVDGDKRFTYAQFGERTSRLAAALVGMGMVRGDRIAMLAYNSHPLLEAYYGVLEAGCVLLPVNLRLSGEEVAYVLEHAQARVVIADAELAPLVNEALPLLSSRPQLVWIGDRPAGRSEPGYEELLAAAPPEPPPVPPIDENDVAELFYTSGTTGRPRGVMLTHRNLYLHAMSMMIAFRCAESDVQLHTIPLYHVNGWGTPQGITAAGGRHVMLRKFDPSEVFRLVQQERVTRLFAVPTMVTMLLSHPDLERWDLSSLELVNTGGAPTPPEMVRRAERLLGCPVVGGYGLTETSPIICFAADKTYLANDDEDTRVRRRASTGLPLVGSDVTIMDEQGREVPWDGTSVGEIVVRGNVVTRGYWRDEAATAEAIRDGWLHTGDLATIDTEGYVLIVDRKKDIIVTGGENVSSIEVEKLLYEHPAVLECAVIGVPDERWGEAVKAIVAVRPGATATEDELTEFCRGRLAGFKVPRSVVFVDALPKSGTGKILKRQLREPYWAGADKRVH